MHLLYTNYILPGRIHPLGLVLSFNLILQTIHITTPIAFQFQYSHSLLLIVATDSRWVVIYFRTFIFIFIFLTRKCLLRHIFLSQRYSLNLFCPTKTLKESFKRGKPPVSSTGIIKDGWHAEVVDGGDPLGDYDGQTRAERRRDI